jgi:catechol 2,3-dioxygenase-like lactoylglutathione lyase family enzyme
MQVKRILETSLDVSDVARSREFYERVFGFRLIFAGEPRLNALSVNDEQVLLLFAKGQTEADVQVPGGVIPGHGTEGSTHIAFAIETEEVKEWERHLLAKGVTLESKVDMPMGGCSLYFRDPDGHLIELATPGTWPIY